MKTAFVFATVFAIFAAVVMTALTEDEIAKYKEIAAYCRTKEGASEDDVKNLLKKQKQTSARGKCLVKCILLETNMLRADGKVNIAQINKLAAKENSNQATNIVNLIKRQCVPKITGSGSCDEAEAFRTCIYEIVEGYINFHN